MKSQGLVTSRTTAAPTAKPRTKSAPKKYNALKAKVPTINWQEFKEVTDNVEGAQQLACSAGSCEI